MKASELTARELAALVAVGPAPRLAKEVQASLAETGEEISGPSFFHMMNRLADLGLVKADTPGDGVQPLEIKYKRTAKGTAVSGTTRLRAERRQQR